MLGFEKGQLDFVGLGPSVRVGGERRAERSGMKRTT